MIPLRSTDLTSLRQTFVSRTGHGTADYRITPRSPWPSEIFALFALGVDHCVRTWLESGTYHGQAIEVLARATPEARCLTVEFDKDVATEARRRLAWLFPRVQVVEGDGRAAIYPLADSVKTPVGVFLDGPKSLDAVIVARSLLDRYPQVAFVGMHDMPRSVSGRAVPARAAIEELGAYESSYRAWATDDEDYVAFARDLDEGLHAAHVTESGRSGWRPYEHFANGRSMQMRSYGPTVAFLIRRSGS